MPEMSSIKYQINDNAWVFPDHCQKLADEKFKGTLDCHVTIIMTVLYGYLPDPRIMSLIS